MPRLTLTSPESPAFSHQALHALSRNHYALTEPELGRYAPRPIDAAIAGVDGLDALDQPEIG